MVAEMLARLPRLQHVWISSYMLTEEGVKYFFETYVDYNILRSADRVVLTEAIRQPKQCCLEDDEVLATLIAPALRRNANLRRVDVRGAGTAQHELETYSAGQERAFKDAQVSTAAAIDDAVSAAEARLTARLKSCDSRLTETSGSLSDGQACTSCAR